MPKQHNIKYVIFDLGDVLFIDTEKAFDNMFQKNALPPKKQTEYHNAKILTERGKKPTTYLLKEMKKLFKLKWNIQQLEKLLTETILIEPMYTLYQAVKKDHQTAILTNNQKAWPDKIAKYLGINYDGSIMFNSAKVGLRKPDRQIYKYVQTKLKVKPSEIVFIDDRDYNLTEPKKLGWNTIEFNGNIKKVVSDLKKLGIKVKM